MMKAPFKRGTSLQYTCPRHGTQTVVKYVKWWGIMRSALIVVRFPNGKETTVHVNDVKAV